MVKNTHGGNKHKSLARKSVNASSNVLRIPQVEGECFAFVTQMSGNSICKVSVFYNNLILYNINCHIRGKFKSKNKHQNTVNKQSFILVGMRDWESSLKNCDLLEVFSNNSLSQLCSLSSSFASFFSTVSSSDNQELDDLFSNSNIDNLSQLPNCDDNHTFAEFEPFDWNDV